MGKVPGDKFLVPGWEAVPRSFPGTRNQEPGTSSPIPGTRNQEPGTSSPIPGTRNKEPGTFSNRGINLITALFILIALSAIGLLLYRLVLTQQESALRHLYSGEALYIAEAGQAWAIHNLEVDCNWGQIGETPDCSGLPLTAKPALCQVALANGTAYVSVATSGAGDDNVPAGSDVDGESCEKKTIESVGRRLGTSGRLLAERRIRVTVD